MATPASANAAPLVHEAWRRCALRILPSLPADELDRLFRSFVYDRYTEPQRHYHNVRHLEEMLGHLRTYETQHGWHGDYAPALVDEADKSTSGCASRSGVQREWSGTVLLLSILFHDAVYDPKRGDNEEKSAELALDFLNRAEKLYKASQDRSATGGGAAADSAVPSPSLLWAHSDAAQFVRATTSDYIAKTKVHLSVPPKQALQLAAPPTPDAVASSHDDPLHVFLDLDLAILGSPDLSLYQTRYAANIEREYSHYPPADFLKGRSAFLGGFLDSAQWYKTPFFFARLEAQARRNTTAEVAELKARLARLEASAKSNC